MKKNNPISKKTNIQETLSSDDFIELIIKTDLHYDASVAYDDQLTNQIMAGIQSVNNNDRPATDIRSIITVLVAAMLTGVFFGFHLKDGFKSKFKTERNQKIEALRSDHFLAPPTSNDTDFNPFM